MNDNNQCNRCIVCKNTPQDNKCPLFNSDNDRIQDFKDKYPQYADERFEICDNGTVFVHGNCAYPLIIKNAVESIG